MVDIVVNHLAWIGAPDTVDYSIFPQFNSPDYFHPYCKNNYLEENVVSLLQHKLPFAQIVLIRDRPTSSNAGWVPQMCLFRT